jgi:2-oxoglutarate ferredoxin oxidoreductase subunit alpha
LAVNDLVIGAVGRGGDGVILSGELLMASAASQGLYGYMVQSYGPQIRGGESSFRARFNKAQVSSPGDFLDLLVVFDWPAYKMFKQELRPKGGAFVLHDEDNPAPEGESAPGRLLAAPFAKLSKSSTGGLQGKNVVMLGVLCGLFGFDAEGVRAGIKKKFAKKGDEVLAKNLAAFEAGLSYGRSNATTETKNVRLDYVPGPPKLVLSGNEALALGALHAGCRFYAGYPITPSSEILEFMGKNMPRFGGSFIQAEDELASIGMVLGASFGGTKAMTATSGPGFSLMTEMVGLGSMMEIPAVIVDVQRTGPSTGIPTKSEQSDLWQAVFGTHGDAPRVVLAPSDVEDCFHAAVDAFNIAEEYQLPVVILSDQLLAQRKVTLPSLPLDKPVFNRRQPAEADLEGGYKRYRLDGPDGVSPMAVPGDARAIYQTTGLEHNENGEPTSSFHLHEAMNEKRFKKLKAIAERYHYVRRYGPEGAEIGILAWGSSKGAIKEAVASANAKGLKVAAFIPELLYPFPKHELEAFIKPLKRIIVLELSYSAQFYKYLRTFLELPEERVLLKKRSGGEFLGVAEVESAIEEAFQ